MIDTHAHLYVEEFGEDVCEVLERAKAVGLSKIFLPNINRESLVPMMALCKSRPDFLYPMMGLHPTDVTSDYREVLDGMEAMLETDHSFIAVGEVGLDLYWDTTYKKEQEDAFARQVEWAVKYHLPLMIHTRNAQAGMLRILDAYRHESLTGVFHCFSGTEEESRQLLAYEGFLLGINGVVTFKKSTLSEVLRQVPLARIVLETDSPYLAPVPHRGKRNESSYLIHVASRLADIYQMPVEEIVATTDKNVLRVFTRAK